MRSRSHVPRGRAHRTGLVALLVAMVVVLLLCSCAPPAVAPQAATVKPTTAAAAAPGKATFKLGSVATITGPLAEQGELQMKAFDLAVEEFNADPANTVRFEIIHRDDKANPTEAVNAATALISVEKVVGLFGPTLSGSILAIEPVARAAGIPFISASGGTSTSVAQPAKPGVYRFTMSNIEQNRTLTNHLRKDRGFDRLAVISDTSALGKPGADELAALLRETGAPPVAQETYTSGDSDMTPQLVKVMEASPQALVVWGVSTDMTTIKRNMKKLGLDVPLIGSNSMMNAVYRDLLKQDVKTSYASWYSTLVQTPRRAATQHFVDRYVAKYGRDKFFGQGQEPDPYLAVIACPYDGAMVFMKASQEAQGDPKKTIEILDSGKVFEGVTNPTIKFSPTSHDSLTSADNAIFEILPDRTVPWTR